MHLPKQGHSHLLCLLSLSGLLLFCLFTSCRLYQNQPPKLEPEPQPIPEPEMIPKWEGIYEGTFFYHYEAEEEIYDQNTGEFLGNGIVAREEEKEIRVRADWETETELVFYEEMKVVKEIEFSVNTSTSDASGLCFQDDYFIGYRSRMDRVCLTNFGDQLSIRREISDKVDSQGLLKVLITFEGDRIQ